MKNTIIFICTLVLVFTACDPMKDVYSELDNAKDFPGGSVEYTPNADDYALASSFALKFAQNAADSALAKSIKTDEAFNQLFTAEDYMTAILSSNFQGLGKKSTALVTYNTTVKPEELVFWETAKDFKITDADYASVGGKVGDYKYFIPSSTAEDNIPTILSANYPSAIINEVKLVSYKYSDVEPEAADKVEVTLLEEDFSAYANYDPIDKNGWASAQKVGERTWVARAYSGNVYAQFSSFGSAELNEAYIISPQIDLTGVADATLAFDANVGYFTHEGLEVVVSTDYNGVDFASATWTALSGFTIPTEPASGYGTFTTSGKVALSAFSGKIYVAFKYSGDGNNAKTTTYQIDNVKVVGTTTVLKSAKITTDYVEYNDFYVFSGTSWKKSSVATAVQPFEYDQMGSPGKYNNFSTTDAPANYLPALLQNRYPYAQEGDNWIVGYKYYSGGTKIKADMYTFSNGMWTSPSNASIITLTSQFIHNGEKWNFDPAISYTMVGADYQVIVDYVKNTFGEAFVDSYGTAEFYYGAAASYAHCDKRTGNRNSAVFETADLAVVEAIVKVLLPAKFPDAVIQVSGIDVIYTINYATYDGANGTGSLVLKCTKEGPNPAFEIVSK